MFFHCFEYEKIKDLPDEEFLESKHQRKIKNTAQNWKGIKNVFDLQLRKTSYWVNSSNTEIKFYTTGFFIFRREIIIKKENENIQLKIKSLFISFLPDFGSNYFFLEELIKKVEVFNSLEETENDLLEIKIAKK
ncbi:hypothetical protein [Aureivirga marina]|uniref:hypothetical protein n=1 Tax=Aureivirga marina TaxID=1182451 RepID=UPI0018CA99AC|nr:hypothetical protein [Aureivirga marina]